MPSNAHCGPGPENGVPDNPQGWLVTVARNRIRDFFASAAVRSASQLDEVAAELAESDLDAIPDKRLELLFACAHPAISPEVRTPLMLQVVLGFDAFRIAQVFSVEPAAMAQRLVRAKRRIRRQNGHPLSGAHTRRLSGTITCWSSKPFTAPTQSTGSTSMSTYANRSLMKHAGSPFSPQSLLDTEPEAWGLAALLTLAQSRAPAQNCSALAGP